MKIFHVFKKLRLKITMTNTNKLFFICIADYRYYRMRIILIHILTKSELIFTVTFIFYVLYEFIELIMQEVILF